MNDKEKGYKSSEESSDYEESSEESSDYEESIEESSDYEESIEESSDEESLSSISYLHLLNNYQLKVFNECKEKRCAGISIPMGSGKTLLSIILALEFTPKSPTIIVCKKSLISNWVYEFDKFFGDKVSYYVYHKDINKNCCKLSEITTQFILTTPETLRKSYKTYDLSKNIVKKIIMNEGLFGQHELLTYYNKPKYNKANGLLHGTFWGTIIVDEFNTMNNIKSIQCLSVLSLCGDRKWALSGTLFDEPKAEKIISYYLFIEDKSFPNNVPEAKTYLKSSRFKGYGLTTVYRKHPPFIIEYNEHLITTEYNKYEEIIYLQLRDFILELYERVQTAQQLDDFEFANSIRGKMLGMLSTLRQCLISPISALSSVLIDLMDCEDRSLVSDNITNICKSTDIYNYLNDDKNIISSRIKKTIDICNKHDKIVIFSAFRSNIVLFTHIVKDKRLLTITGDMSLKERKQIIEQCQDGKPFILILTFQIGSSGLNLQVANTVIFMDYDWNTSCVTQGRARVVRQGQSQIVNVYYLMSNTGVEQAVFKKHSDKLTVSNQLSVGCMTSKITRISIKDIINILQQEKTNEIHNIAMVSFK